MKRFLLGIAVLAAIAVVTFVDIEITRPPDIVVNPMTDTTSSAPTDAPENGEVIVVQSAKFDPQTYDPQAGEPVTFSDMLGIRRGVPNLFSAEDEARYNELHVVAFNPSVGRRCEYDDGQPRSDDHLTGRWAQGVPSRPCRVQYRDEPHPYTRMETSDLLALAKTDAAAAVIAASRVERPEALELYVRAAALSGKPGPLLKAANRFFVSLEKVERRQPSVDHDMVAYRIAHEIVAGLMGDPRAASDEWIAGLRKLDPNRETVAETVTRAQQHANEMIAAMIAVQDEFGITSLREVIRG